MKKWPLIGQWPSIGQFTLRAKCESRLVSCNKYALNIDPAAAAADESTSDEKRAQVQARSSSSSAARFHCHSTKTPYYQKGLL